MFRLGFRNARLGLVAILGLGTGAGMATSCVAPSAFSCEDDAGCGSDGLCEANGFCSFPSDIFPDGCVYGDLSPAELAGTCVGGSGETGGEAEGATSVGDGDGDGCDSQS